MRTPFLAVLRCEAVVWRRRREIVIGRRRCVYDKSQCLRRHGKDSPLCRQHWQAWERAWLWTSEKPAEATRQ